MTQLCEWESSNGTGMAQTLLGNVPAYCAKLEKHESFEFLSTYSAPDKDVCQAETSKRVLFSFELCVKYLPLVTVNNSCHINAIYQCSFDVILNPVGLSKNDPL